MKKSTYYLIDLNNIGSKVDLWRRVFPTIEPKYAVKCNPSKIICKYLASKNIGFDVASRNEIKLISGLTDKTSPNQFSNQQTHIYANPQKEISSILYAKKKGIRLSVYDSEEELHKFRDHFNEARLLLRIKVDDSSSLCKFSEKFGASLEEAKCLLKISKKLDLDTMGVSFHVGSGCKDPTLFKHAFGDVRSVFSMAKDLNIKLKMVDIGGGFPGSDPELFTKIGSVVNSELKKFEDVKFIAEPGRFFVEESHTLILTVIGKKRTFDKISYYLSDGVYGSFSCIMFDYQKPELKSFRERGPLYSSVFFGPTCDSLDKICETKFKELFIGDKLYVKNFGAYTISSSTEFNGFKKVPLIYSTELN